MQQIYDYIDDHWHEALDDLKRLCRQPSISAQGVGMAETVQLVSQMMQDYGLSTRILPTTPGGYPVDRP